MVLQLKFLSIKVVIGFLIQYLAGGALAGAFGPNTFIKEIT